MNTGTIKIDDRTAHSHDEVDAAGAPPNGTDPADSAETETNLPEATRLPEGSVAEPADPSLAELDLRDLSEPDFHSLLAAPPPPPAPKSNGASSDSHVTLGSLAFRLFDTIENQIARDPHAATLTMMSSRLEMVERSAAAVSGQSDMLAGLTERTDQIEKHLAAPNPHDAAITAVNDRLAAVEHRQAAPHPHTGTISSVVERLDEVEAKGSPRNLTAMSERLHLLERHSPPPEVITQMTDRVVALERRLTAPELIEALMDRVDQLEMRDSALDTPIPDRGAGRRLMSLLTFLAIVVAVVTVALMMAA